MNDYNNIISAITTVGFPIVAYAALFWYMIKQNESHKEEVRTLTEAVNELRVTMTRLCAIIGGGKDDSNN